MPKSVKVWFRDILADDVQTHTEVAASLILTGIYGLIYCFQYWLP